MKEIIKETTENRTIDKLEIEIKDIRESRDSWRNQAMALLDFIKENTRTIKNLENKMEKDMTTRKFWSRILGD